MLKVKSKFFSHPETPTESIEQSIMNFLADALNILQLLLLTKLE